MIPTTIITLSLHLMEEGIEISISCGSFCGQTFLTSHHLNKSIKPNQTKKIKNTIVKVPKLNILDLSLVCKKSLPVNQYSCQLPFIFKLRYGYSFLFIWVKDRKSKPGFTKSNENSFIAPQIFLNPKVEFLLFSDLNTHY